VGAADSRAGPAIADWEADTRVLGGDGRWLGALSPAWDVWGPVGGYRAAIALRAIGAEARLRRPATFTCQFLAPGHFAPVEIEVTRLLGGKRAEAFQARMSQEDRLLLVATAWVVERGLDGFEHAHAERPAVPAPEALRGYQDLADNYADWYPFWRSVEGRPALWTRETGPPLWHTWMRLLATPPLGDDPFLDAGRALLWLDVAMWNALIPPHPWPRAFVAPNLDLTAQFHQSGADAEWLLCDGLAPHAGEGLGGCTARLWTPDGRLVASGTSQLICRPNPMLEKEREWAREQREREASG
jgi:acyl-CoA thioesterase